MLIILANGPGAELTRHLGTAALRLYTSLLADTVGVARAVVGPELVVRYSPDTPLAALAALGPDVRLVPVPAGADPVASALDEGLAHDDSALLVGDNLPHLPPWRLQDALTALKSGAPAVVGPDDAGGWYLLGLRAEARSLLPPPPSRTELVATFIRAQLNEHAVHRLPPWFGVATLADLASLLDLTRTMPAWVATQTRALLEDGAASRAVGG